MRTLFISYLLFLNYLTFAQSTVQTALNFYANNILPQERKTKVWYDGFVNSTDSSFQDNAKHIITSFYMGKLNPRGANNDSVVVDINTFNQISQIVGEYKFKKIPISTSKLVIPPPIKKRKKLKYKKLGGSQFKFYSEKICHWIFPIKYNIKIEPPIFFSEYYYVWIRVDKNDYEYGSWYFFKLSDVNKIYDWCEIFWIQ
jgi:hypothetical protein